MIINFLTAEIPQKFISSFQKYRLICKSLFEIDSQRNFTYLATRIGPSEVRQQVAGTEFVTPNNEIQNGGLHNIPNV